MTKLNDDKSVLSTIKTSVNKTHASTAKIYYHATGGDKTAVARVFMSTGTGEMTINKGKSLSEYFPCARLRETVMLPINTVTAQGNFNFKITVKGGGHSGQADAIKLAIANVLVKYDESYKKLLRAAGCITRDKRKVERKKYGLRKARKKEQYSKR